MSECKLTILSAYKPSEIPSKEAIISAANDLLASTASYKEGKTFGSVKTYSRPKSSEDGAPWYMRVSEHSSDEVTFDALWQSLSVNKAENEKDFIPEINKVTKVKEISSSQQIWTMYYKFPPPVSPRVFTVVQDVSIAEKDSRRSGVVVSLPVDLSGKGDEELAKKEEKGVKGKYVSVEQVRELGDGKIEWRMATSSSPGGMIPAKVAEMSMPKSIAQDVPHLLDWLEKKKETK